MSDAFKGVEIDEVLPVIETSSFIRLDNIDYYRILEYKPRLTLPGLRLST